MVCTFETVIRFPVHLLFSAAGRMAVTDFTIMSKVELVRHRQSGQVKPT
jgi:hypothetical protein